MKKLLFILVFAIFAIPVFSQTVTTKFKCYFFDEHMNWTIKKSFPMGVIKKDGSIIGKIPAFEEVDVISIDTVWYTFYKVRYKNKVGLIHRDVVIDKSLILSVDPNIRDKYRDCAKSKAVAIGMNKYEVTATLGAPQDINKTVSMHSQNEQWCYTASTNHMYVYFENDVVVTIQN